MAAPEIATEYSQQIVETEHLLKALLEQPNGLARRVISKAGSDATRLLDKTDAFIRRQPRVTGDTAQQVCVCVCGLSVGLAWLVLFYVTGVGYVCVTVLWYRWQKESTKCVCMHDM